MSPFAVLVVVAALLTWLCRRQEGSKPPQQAPALAAAAAAARPPPPPGSPTRLPHRSLRDLHARYGTDGGLLFLQLGRRPTLVVSTPAAAVDLYKNHDLAFASPVPSAVVDKLTYGSDNISFAPYGDAWRRSKKMAVVHLLSPRRADSFAPVRAAEVAALVAGIRRAAAAAVAGDGAVEVREHLYEYSNAVVTRAATGAAGATAERIKRLLGNSAAFMSGLQAEDVMPDAAAKLVRWATGLEKRLDREVEAWDEFLSEIVAEHMEKNRNLGAGEEDFLDVLLRLREEGTAGLELTDDRIKSIIKDMIGAGTETSSLTLEWAMVELVRNPRVMDKLQEEIAQVTGNNATIEEDDLSRMEYLKAVLKEVLRLHPPAPLLIPHQSTTAAVVQGYEIPARTAVFINVWAIGRDPAAWGETADEFRPERFLASGSAAGVDMRGDDYQLLPFGAGRRLCPGISFAMPVLEGALASLVRHFDWELPAGTRLNMTEAPGLTTPPLAPLRLVPKCGTLV